jgi:alpha-D-ribose 1-methylphosphonate 5-triphosphate synthase subunit PhnG
MPSDDRLRKEGTVGSGSRVCGPYTGQKRNWVRVPQSGLGVVRGVVPGTCNNVPSGRTTTRISEIRLSDLYNSQNDQLGGG